jgi:hypothetical protein
MFMEGGGPPAEEPSPAPEPQAAPQPAAPAEAATAEGASDAKGWTVFMDKSPVGPGAGQPAPPSGPMQFATGGQAVSGESVQNEAPQPEIGKGRTVIASGVQAVAGPQGGVTGRAPAAGEQPDTMYFKRGETEPERVSQTPGAEEVHVAASGPAIEGAAPQPAAVQPQAQPPASMGTSDATPAVAPGRSAPVAYEEPSGGNKTVIIVAGVAVVIGLVAAAILFL